MEELIGAAQEVIQDLRMKWREAQEQEPLSHIVMGFIHAVDWTEPWIIGLLGVLATILLLSILTRKHLGMQAALFGISGLTMWMGEHINRLANKHWQSFSRQNYFDRRGVFFGAVVGLPLLVTMFIILINYLIACASLLVQAKRKELQHKARQKKKAQEAAAAAAGSNQGAGTAGASGSGSSSQPVDKKKQ